MRCLLILISILVEFSHQTNYRLPNNTRPYRYQIQLTPDITEGKFSFEGESKIFLEIFQPIRNLTLHSVNLHIYEESTKLVGDDVLKPQRHIFNDETQFLILNFHDNIQPGFYFLYLKYNGKLNSRPLGFFMDFYFTDDNRRIFLAATQFETVFARMAFPCWDEPAIKATFDISIKHFPNYTALSNMPVKETIDEREIDGKVWSIFQRTPQISTYLVSFSISQFQNVSNSNGNFSLWSDEKNLKYLNLAYDIGIRTFPVLEEYTGIEYSLPKMDIFGVPGLSFGAMENWGLITVTEHLFLSYKHTSMEENFITSTIIVHEIAHQWFGNLVTPAWWDDVWITEGLATYMHYYILGKVMNFPRIMDLFILRNNFQVLLVDNFDGTEAIYREIKSPKDTEIHLTNVHNKGATVMHIIRGLVSEEVFHSGIKKMLQKYKYKTITTDDFWQTMQEAMEESKLPYNSFDIKLHLNGYISQTGYPLINIDRNYETGIIKLNQTGKVVCKHSNCKNVGKKFWVPINVATESSQDFSSSAATYWLDPNNDELIIDGINSKEWYIINIQSVGFYRVNYDKENWQRIIKYMNSPNFTNIHVLNRAKLLDDAYFLFLNGKLERSLLLDLASYLIREKDYIPWKGGEKILFYISRSRVKTSEDKEFLLSLVQSLIDHVEITAKPNDDLLTNLKRDFAFKWLCKVAKRYCDKIDI